MTNLAQTPETNNKLSPYEIQANEFLTKTGTTFKCEFSHNGNHFANDKENRDIYDITLTRGTRKYSFKFGQSINKSGFYYTKGKQVTPIDRKHLDKSDNQLKEILNDAGFMYNGKSDIIHRPTAPTPYDVLACLQKYDIGTFSDCCSEFGYDEESRTAESIYNAVCEEYKSLCTLYTDSELEEMSEIQ